MPAKGMTSVFHSKKTNSENLQVDEILVEIDGVVMKMFRRSTLAVPAEVSAIIPRVEIRNRAFENGQLVSEREMILNSITIVHAPRHLPAGESQPEGGEAEGNITVFPGAAGPRGEGVEHIIPLDNQDINKESMWPKIIVNGRVV